jgi:hypothetical protein
MATIFLRFVLAVLLLYYEVRRNSTNFPFNLVGNCVMIGKGLLVVEKCRN